MAHGCFNLFIKYDNFMGSQGGQSTPRAIGFSKYVVEVPNATYNYEIIKSTVDENQTSHVRMQQTYKNYPVWGATAVMHTPNRDQITGTAANSKSEVFYNGIIYQDLEADLKNTPNYIFGSAQANKALTESIQRFQEKNPIRTPIQQSKVSLMVYVDENSKAHWVYQVTFKAAPKMGLPANRFILLMH